MNAKTKRPRFPAGDDAERSERHERQLAWALFALCFVLTATGAVLYLSSRSTPTPASFGSRDAAYVDALVFLVMPLIGALVLSKQEEHPLGWLFSLTGLSLSLWAAFDAYAVRALLIDTTLPGGEYAAWLAGLIWIPGWALTGFIFLLFPTGRFLSPGWRWAGWCLGITAVVTTIVFAITPGPLRDYEFVDNPFGIDWIPLTNWQMGVAAVVLIVIAGAPSVVCLAFRLQHSRGVRRQQLKWLVWAAGLMVAVIGMWAVLAPLGVRERGLEAASTLAAAGIPIAAGVAVLRYRLWDIDLIINRTIVYGIVSALLGGMYFGSIVLLQTTLDQWTRGSDLAISASTLAVAAMFRPALRRVQAGVDYRFYRRRYDAQRTIEAFRSRVREQTDLDELRVELVHVVQDTMQPTITGVWLRPPSEP